MNGYTCKIVPNTNKYVPKTVHLKFKKIEYWLISFGPDGEEYERLCYKTEWKQVE